MPDTRDEHDTRELADRLLFRLEREGSGYALTRDVDVPEPVRHENISLAEAKEILNTWKLRGLHGG